MRYAATICGMLITQCCSSIAHQSGSGAILKQKYLSKNGSFKLCMQSLALSHGVMMVFVKAVAISSGKLQEGGRRSRSGVAQSK
jgi:hypothetical protein